MEPDFGYRYKNIKEIVGDFTQGSKSEQLYTPPLRTVNRDMHYSIEDVMQNGVSMGAAAMNDPNYYQYNEFMMEGPLPHFKSRSAQLNTDLHLPPHLFRPNRRETYHEELYGPPSGRYNPEIYGNANISGRIRNYTSLADKNRLMKGAYNFYTPVDTVCEESGGNTGCGSVFDGFSNGMQKTERRRVNYGLERVPHSEEMLRNLVPLTSPMENVFSNRLGGTSTSYLGLGTMYNNPNLSDPYTHAGPGEKHYWRNEGVSEVNPQFEQYRQPFIGYQQIYPEFGNFNPTMRFQQRELTENGIRMPTVNDNLYKNNPNTFNDYLTA